VYDCACVYVCVFVCPCSCTFVQVWLVVCFSRQVEELVRKLFLTSFVVLFNDDTAVAVTLAVLVSFAAHTLHAVYEPWGEGSLTYNLQHMALTATEFVFLVGLIFKSGAFVFACGCVYACMLVRMFACTYVFMYGLHVCMYSCVVVRTHIQMYV
jgi:hypothetical protein